MLKVFEFNKPFEVHMDVNNFVIEGVLMQDGRLICYESKKLNGYQRRQPIHKELFVKVVHYLKM